MLFTSFTLLLLLSFWGALYDTVWDIANATVEKYWINSEKKIILDKFSETLSWQSLKNKKWTIRCVVCWFQNEQYRKAYPQKQCSEKNVQVVGCFCMKHNLIWIEINEQILFFFKLLILYWSIASQQCCDIFRWTTKNSAIPIHESILPQTPLPSSLPHNFEQSFLWKSSTYNAKVVPFSSVAQLCPTLRPHVL